MSTSTLSEVAAESSIVEGIFAASPWSVVVWDDPVNTMEYVEYVFQSYFNYSRKRARALMLQVHRSGQAVVSEGSREKAETDLMAMHSFGLQATVRQGGHD